MSLNIAINELGQIYQELLKQVRSTCYFYRININFIMNLLQG